MHTVKALEAFEVNLLSNTFVKPAAVSSSAGGGSGGSTGSSEQQQREKGNSIWDEISV